MDKIRMKDKKYPPSYTFDITSIDNQKVTVRREDDEPDFKINDELHKAVYERMPNNISPEEKALFIYYRLCKIMNYDGGYIYDRNVAENHRYNSDFSKEYLESIVPGSKIVCWDFARIYAKFINELGPEIDAVTISYGKSNITHWQVGFYTDRISLLIDPVDVSGSDNLNDLARIKNGIWPGNIHPDRNMTPENSEWLVQIMDDMYTSAVGQLALEWDDKISLLKQIPKTEASENFEEKLNAFITMLKNRNITGNEAVLTMFKFNKELDFFSEDIVETILWDESKEEPTRLLALQGQDKSQAYILNLDEVTIQKSDIDIMQKRINSGEYKYENEKYQLVRD